MTERPQYDELKKRIVEHLDNSQNDKELVSACWHGYLAALLEWGFINAEDHARLISLLPPVDPNPVLQIFLGN